MYFREFYKGKGSEDLWLEKVLGIELLSGQDRLELNLMCKTFRTSSPRR